MLSKYFKIVTSLLMTMLFLVLSGYSAQAAGETLEVGEVRSLGDEVKVPVILRNTTYLTSMNVEIMLPTTSKGVTLQGFEPARLFDGELFRTVSIQSGNTLKLDVLSQTGDAQQVKDKALVVGYITYRLSADFKPGDAAISLEITHSQAVGRNGLDLIIIPLDGKVERKMPVGDVIGKNAVTVAGAMRILQHADNPITDREQFLSADVDGDGVLTQQDAQHILDYITGMRTSFLAIQAKELDTAVLKSEYYEKVEGLHGREPYQFKRSGTLPSGIKLDDATGELTGAPSRAGTYNFGIIVTDATGETAERKFTIEVIDSNITSVEKLEPINVKRGETPALPSEVTVTYKDKTIGKETVRWSEMDTSILGTMVAKGKVGNTGFTISVTIHVVDADYVNHIETRYVQILGFYSVIINTEPDVATVTVNTIPAHYEGNNQFSLGSSTFKRASIITIRVYDKYGNLLETKQQQL